MNYSALYIHGDSWTSGDITDPALFPDQPWHAMHPDNDAYRLPKVWPGKLEKKLPHTKVINRGFAGSSNDRIVRETVNDVLGLLETYKPEDIHVIIGWTSPERKDFFYRPIGEKGGAWDTIYPAEMHHWTDEDDSIRNEFYKNYVSIYWNEEEYITRYVLNVVTLSGFLNSLGISHNFFNAFYESPEVVIDIYRHQLLEAEELDKVIEDFKIRITDYSVRHLGLTHLIEEYQNIYKANYIKKTFVGHLKEQMNEHKLPYDDLFDVFHPSELGHEKWANYLYTVLFN